MKAKYVIYGPEYRKQLDYDEVLDKVKDRWDMKAKKLRERRWKQIRHNEKTNGSFKFGKQAQDRV